MKFESFTYADRLKIRQAYEKVSKPVGDPYSIWPHDWLKYMSPIEQIVWDDLRCYCLPFLPQYPCGEYFIDFASPSMGIAIEADSSQWHPTREVDKKRHKYIQDQGFIEVYYLRGWEIMKGIDSNESDNRYKQVFMHILRESRNKREWSISGSSSHDTELITMQEVVDQMRGVK